MTEPCAAQRGRGPLARGRRGHAGRPLLPLPAGGFLAFPYQRGRGGAVGCQSRADLCRRSQPGQTCPRGLRRQPKRC